MTSESFWWCGLCRTRVDDRRVTFEEYHEGCGGTCVVMDEEADVFAEAREWQAFRDWLNGVDDGEMVAWRRALRETRISSYREGSEHANLAWTTGAYKR
jgi:hypothetical protein